MKVVAGRCPECNSNRLNKEAVATASLPYSEASEFDIPLTIQVKCAKCGKVRGMGLHIVTVIPNTQHLCTRIHRNEDHVDQYVVTSSTIRKVVRIRVKETEAGFERPLWRKPATYYEVDMVVRVRCVACRRSVVAYDGKSRLSAKKIRYT